MSLISIQGLTKAYPGVVANKNVSFDIGRGEIHALLAKTGLENQLWLRRFTDL